MFLYNADSSANLTVYIVGQRIDLSDRLTNKLRSFASLRIGWDYGSGEPIPHETIDSALSWYNFLRTLQLFDIDAFPGGSGEILLGVRHDDHYLEVIIEPDGTVTLAYDFRGKAISYLPRMLPEDAKKALSALAGRICGSFAYFIPTGSIRGSIASQAWHSEIPAGTAAFPSLIHTAYSQMGQSYAHTSGNIMEVLPESHPSYGNLIPIYSPRAIA